MRFKFRKIKTHAVLHHFLADYEISRRNTMSRRLQYKQKKYRMVGEAEETVEEIRCLAVYVISTRSTEASERPKKHWKKYDVSPFTI
jgi:hypothetical protein